MSKANLEGTGLVNRMREFTRDEEVPCTFVVIIANENGLPETEIDR